MKKFLLLLIAILALLSCSSDDSTTPETKYGSLSGIVYKYGTDSVIAGAAVYYGNTTVNTDAAGHFLLSNLEAGQKISMTISKSGYQSTVYQSEITADYERQLTLSLLKFDCIPVTPQSDIDITIPATGNPNCFIPANTIVDGNNSTPLNAVLNMTYAHNTDNQFITANADAYTADSAGTIISLQPVAIVNFGFTESKGDFKFKTGKTASISVESSKSAKSEVRLFFYSNGKFTISNDTLLNIGGTLTAKVSQTGRWLFAKITENNLPQAVVSATPNNGTIETRFFFDARRSSDLDGDQLQARWCFNYQGGDSIPWNTGYSSDLTANWQYTSAGTYLVKVEIIDSKGGIAHAITEIMVTSGQSSGERVKIEMDSSYTGNSWQETMKNTYHYNGNLGANFIGQVFYNGAYHDSLKGTVTYDGNNRPIRLEEFHWTGTTFLAHSTIDKTYNSNGQLTQVISVDTENGSNYWEKTVYSYSGTNLDSAEFFNKQDGVDFKFQSYHFFYNAIGKVSKAVVKNYYGSTTSQTEYRYFYNADGTIQMREHWSVMDNTSNKIAHTKFVYANGNLSYAETFQIINGNQDQLSERYEFTYSGNLLTNKKRLTNYTVALEVEQENIYKYNSNGHLIHEQENNPHYPEMNKIKAYSYENGLGNLSTLNSDIEIANNLINPLNLIRPTPVK